ncbi:hypothetical protein CLIB1444_07S03466 [[Candida] jaroonii]|uniref:Uncharacterized protein n=1 Tax=[Candida] jaroonii TaxID=467808 RepID=A0ACA9YB31_9ASCO|nr:hypothetical protein CLIB1444_07S03466 [[Candida] jaroonii]
MVAEPVSATIDTLRYIYDGASKYVYDSTEKVKDLNVYQYNPFKSSEPQIVSEKTSLLKVIKCHKTRLTVFSVGVGLGLAGLWIYSRKPKRTKPRRRVPKLENGARQDIILIVGSPTEPMTRLIALDFERRGFIVYLTILDNKDLKYTESNPITDDINYLNLTNSESFEYQLSKFHNLLEIPVVPFPGAQAHNLKLVGVVFAPSLYFPIGPIENISIASWNKLMEKLSTYFKLVSSGLINLLRSQKAKTIVITPTITSSLNLPFHGPEAIFQNTLQSLFTTLTREVTSHGLSITQIKLGNISVSSSNSTLKTSSIINSEVQSWSEDIKSLYKMNFTKSQFRINPIKSTGRGANLRDLYHVIFDLVYSKRSINPPIVYCGTGARAYDWLASILPSSFISWILF